MISRIEALIRNYPFFFSLVITSALFVTILLIFRPFFSTNDDVVMMMIASGTGVCNQPDEHLVFTNILLGALLKKLYQEAPDCPWYGYYQIFVHFISSLFILYSILRFKFSKTRLLLFIIYFLSAGLEFTIFLQFTTTAFAIGQSGILLLLSILNGLHTDKRTSTPLVLVSILLLVLSALIRIESFYLVMLLAIPALAITFLNAYGNRPVRVAYFFFFILLTPSIIALRMYHLHSYEKEADWKGFYTFNALRAKFTDYGMTQFDSRTADIFRKVRWSQNDYQMLITWFFADRDVFSTAKMKEVLSHFPSHRSWNIDGLLRTLNGLVRDLGFRNSILLAILFIVILNFRVHHRWLIYCTLLMILFLIVYQTLFLRLILRVLYPMVSFLLVLMFFYAENGLPFIGARNQPRQRLRIAWTCLCMLVIALALFSSVTFSYQRSQYIALKTNELKQSIKKLKPQPGQLFVIWANSFPYVFISPFQGARNLSDFRMLAIGWPIQSPIAWNVMKEFEIRDLYKALYEKENVLLVSREGRNELYKLYVKEHYGVDVDFEVYYKEHQGESPELPERHFTVYQIRTIDRP